MPDTTNRPGLRGYMVSGQCPEEGAVLVFAPTARDARRMAWDIPVNEHGTADGYTDVRVKWLKRADPKAWEVTAPIILQPPGCARCELWYDTPVNPETGLCEDCTKWENDDV